jgi:hypothetical protein
MRTIFILLMLPFLLPAQTEVYGYRIFNDQSTPTAPASGKTAVYTKSGKECSNSSGAGEICLGSGSGGAYTAVTYSATPTFTCSSNTVNSFAITLTGNVTSSTLASCSTGQFIVWKICQDSSGSHSFVWPTDVLNSTTVDSTASGCSNQTFIYNGTNAIPITQMYVTGLAGSAIVLPGSTSGTTVVTPAATGGGALTLPAGNGAILANPMPAVTYSSLGTPSNGTFYYCSDCAIANPCTGSGTGALAKRLNGAWVCN